jgi:hypothetical protein
LGSPDIKKRANVVPHICSNEEPRTNSIIGALIESMGGAS